jgi:hypothetical protein
VIHVLKITSPYIRETAVRDDKEGKAIVVKIEPPGNNIGFRLRHGRQTWSLSVKDAYQFARGNSAESVSLGKPKAVTQPSVKAEILNILHAQGKLNIAQVLQQLRKKRMNLTKAQVGEWLDTLKEMDKVRQEGFSYQLTGK